MNAITVSVDFTDYLSLTLPLNRNCFRRYMIVTSKSDLPNVQRLAIENNCELYATDAFYANGASFNKFAALEEGLDVFGRHGWICLLDADIVLPRSNCITGGSFTPFGGFLRAGNLYTPYRRMMIDMDECPDCCGGGINGRPLRNAGICAGCQGKGIIIPPVNEWGRFQIHRNIGEWAGYCQIFHCEDPVLGNPPWHDVTFKHAGAADSLFQNKWKIENKVRPPFECLHLGTTGNWFGRVSEYVQGGRHPEWDKREKQYLDIWQRRRINRANGVDQFQGEKIGT